MYARIFLLLVCIHFSTSTTNTTNQCTVLDKVNGCSTPFRLNIPHRTQFTPACNKHDVCYRCGTTHGWTQVNCDKSFKKKMYAICKSTKQNNAPQVSLKWWKTVYELYQHINNVWKKITQKNTGKEEASRLWKAALRIYYLVLKWHKEKDVTLKCQRAADVYYEAVKNFGVYAFRTRSIQGCNETCAKVAGNPF